MQRPFSASPIGLRRRQGSGRDHPLCPIPGSIRHQRIWGSLSVSPPMPPPTDQVGLPARHPTHMSRSRHGAHAHRAGACGSPLDGAHHPARPIVQRGSSLDAASEGPHTPPPLAFGDHTGGAGSPDQSHVGRYMGHPCIWGCILLDTTNPFPLQGKQQGGGGGGRGRRRPPPHCGAVGGGGRVGLGEAPEAWAPPFGPIFPPAPTFPAAGSARDYSRFQQICAKKDALQGPQGTMHISPMEQQEPQLKRYI